MFGQNHFRGYRLPNLSTMVTYKINKTGGGAEVFYSSRTKLVKVVKSTINDVQILSNILQSGQEGLIVTGVYKSPI